MNYIDRIQVAQRLRREADTGGKLQRKLTDIPWGQPLVNSKPTCQIVYRLASYIDPVTSFRKVDNGFECMNCGAVNRMRWKYCPFCGCRVNREVQE